jgi:hypothetical protein
MALAADRGLRGAPGVRGHHGPVVADVFGMAQAQPDVPAGAAEMQGVTRQGWRRA